jgi:hypothetical protein
VTWLWWIELSAVATLGISAGALLAEACVLVPLWRAMSPTAFLAWYSEHAGLLLAFFGPLEVVSTIAVLLAAGLGLFSGAAGAAAMTLAAGLSLAVLVTFPVYFRRANESFADGSLGEAAVPDELARWARWHQARVALATLAFAVAAMGFGMGG